MDASKIRELQEFVEACKKDPSLLADPSLAFFRGYLHRSASFLLFLSQGRQGKGFPSL
jgi:hypothetical protein